ncbi:methyl-accepting chemotaxis protein [Novosphingobium jiangmenense]|uniref:HAMP domain-containing protein n=1 Tax=Novosphingobium jiangmenense TaxID=2791981 RepID=A0ABS0HFK9_9SPHN|nr:methyl-accepting chemotaxis protein [Novosphingobium jiangmenense]MBF9151051.1 HAMP domain-containing protein [Novosphingobium jiangmenense]
MIGEQTSRGARLVVGLIFAAILVVGLAVSYIRFGGPLHRANLLQDELLADILPPPAFVVEPYLHTTRTLVDPAHAALARSALAEERSLFEQRKAYWASAPIPEELREEVQATIGTADAFWAAVDQRYLPALDSGDIETMRQVHRDELTPAYEKQHDAVERLVEQSTAYRTELMAGANRLVLMLILLFAALAVAVLTIVLLAARAIRQRVVAPLVETAGTMQRMAQGDYSSDACGAERDDEIGMMARSIAVFRDNGIARAKAQEEQQAVVAALSAGLDCMARQNLEYRIAQAFPEGYEELRTNYNSAVDALASAMRTVRVGAASVMTSIAEIRDASDDLARRNEQQASSLAQTAGAMHGVTGRVRETAKGARDVHAAINAAHGEAHSGGEVVRQAVAAMAAIEASAHQIGSIISVIDGIAFQTNLLALNAGVEAARAGESGKGFAVVATEVRALAQRSAEAAQNIKTLIETSTGQVGEGVKLVGETGARLTGIVEQIAAVDALVSQIAESAARQAESLEQVNVAVAEMDRMTQANAAMVEESSAATRSLSAEAERLTDLVSTFRTRDVEKRPGKVSNPQQLRRTSALQTARELPAVVRFGT